MQLHNKVMEMHIWLISSREVWEIPNDQCKQVYMYLPIFVVKTLKAKQAKLDPNSTKRKD